METSKEEEPVFLNRVSRATRGKRMGKLLDEEIEEDELFWNQDALKEEENDENYEEEPEAADIFDSDFDEDEPEPDEEVANEADERIRTKKRLIFPGKALPKKKKKKKVLSKLEGATHDEKSPEQPTLPEHQDVPDDLEVERIVRKSTRTSVIVRQAERDAIRAALQATMKPIKRRKEGEEKRMTQEEMLLEAAQTEIMNLRNLERVLAREEEVKKRAVVHKAVYSGPQIRYLSRNGCSYLEYSNGLSFQSEISTTSTPYPQKAVCAVTGLPAKYRDPKTGLPYATKEAFRIIRQQFLDENSRVSEKKNMGVLFDLISGQGFSERRKRSVISNGRETSYSRFLARFRRIPALDSQVSD
uniref:Putative SWR1 complex subunit 2 isoform X1 n=1 Tax=Davidia involucrata TaxID=16924 RepID=A0A5B6ZXZ8_DAVIN